MASSSMRKPASSRQSHTNIRANLDEALMNRSRSQRNNHDAELHRRSPPPSPRASTRGPDRHTLPPTVLDVSPSSSLLQRSEMALFLVDMSDLMITLPRTTTSSPRVKQANDEIKCWLKYTLHMHDTWSTIETLKQLVAKAIKIETLDGRHHASTKC